MKYGPSKTSEVEPEKILQIFGKEALTYHEHQPELAKRLITQVRLIQRVLSSDAIKRKGVFPIRTPKQLFELCLSLDKAIDENHVKIPDELTEALHDIRRDIGETIIHENFSIDPLEIGEWTLNEYKERKFEEKMVKVAAKFIEHIQSKKPDTITPEWLVRTNRRLYDRIVCLLYERKSENWEPLLELLPKEILEKCEFEKLSLEQAKKNLLDALEQLKDIFDEWPEIAADLIAEMKKMGLPKNTLRKIMRRYLGKTRSTGVGGDLGSLPPEILLEGNKDLFRIAKLLFRRKIYREMMEKTGEYIVGMDGKPKYSSADLIRLSRDVIQKLAHPRGKVRSPEAIKRLKDEMTQEFEEILTLPIPQRLKGVVTTKDEVTGNETSSEVSLRQRIAMFDLLHLKDFDEQLMGKLIAFFMGKGKTLTSFLVYETLREHGKFLRKGESKETKRKNKMLYICPSGVLPQQVADQVREHYKKDHVPSVGIIHSGILHHDLPHVLDKEIVIVPFTMLQSERKDIKSRQKKTIAEFLVETKFDLVVEDEPQNANKPDQEFTRSVRQVLRGLEHVPFIQLSGNPFPNSPRDAVAQLALARPDLYREDYQASELYRIINHENPRKLRSVLHEFVLCLDEPENWQRYITTRDIQLPKSEKNHYEILKQTRATTQQKLFQLLLAAMNPGFEDDDMLDQHSFADECGDQLFAYFNGTCDKDGKSILPAKNSVVLFESMKRLGILLQHDLEDEENEETDADENDPWGEKTERESGNPTLYELVQDRVREKFHQQHGEKYDPRVAYYMIHGDTPDLQREFYLLRARYPHRNPSIKVFLLINTLCEKIRDNETRIQDLESRAHLKTSGLLSSKEKQKETDHMISKLKLLTSKSYRMSKTLVEAFDREERKKEREEENGSSEKHKKSALAEWKKFHPGFDAILEEINKKKEDHDRYVVTEGELTDYFMEALLQSEDEDLKQWLETHDPEEKLQHSIQSVVISEAERKSLVLGKSRSEQETRKNLEKMIEEQFGKERRSEFEKLLPILTNLIQTAQGNSKLFFKTLLPKEKHLDQFLTGLDQEYPEKKDRVTLLAMRQIIGEGIDLSEVERAIFLDPFYILPALAQAAKRLDRKGNQPHMTRLNVPGTVFEGIWRHAEIKNEVVRKLLYGERLSQREILVMSSDTFENNLFGADIYISVLLDSLMTSHQRFNIYTTFLEGKGAAILEKFLVRYGEDYARCFRERWEGSYSNNNARFIGAMIDVMKKDEALMKDGKPFEVKNVIDLGAGLLTFENTYGLSFNRRQLKVDSVEINKHMIEAGKLLLQERRKDHYTPHQVIQANMANLDPKLCPNAHYDIANCALSYHYLSRERSSDERARFLSGMNRILKEGGVGILTFPGEFLDEDIFEGFKDALRFFGFEAMENYSGKGSSKDHRKGERDFENWVLTVKKVGPVNDSDLTTDIENAIKFRRREKPEREKMKEGKPRDQRKAPEIQQMNHHEFSIDGKSPFSYTSKAPDVETDQEAEEARKTRKSARETVIEMIRKYGLNKQSWDKEKKSELKQMGIKVHTGTKLKPSALRKMKPEALMGRVTLSFLEKGPFHEPFTLFEEEEEEEKKA